MFTRPASQEWWGNLPAIVIPPVLFLIRAVALAVWWG
jgi:hypothetical protein